MFKRKDFWIGFAIVFLLLSAVLYFWSNHVHDPDAFYHVKISQIIYSQGLPAQFPWNYFSVLNTHYVDHHYLFHVVLAPFVHFLGWYGLQLFLLIQGLVLFTLVYCLYQTIGLKYKSLFALTPFVLSAQFLFALSTGRAIILSVIFLLTTLIILTKKRYIWIIPIALFYTLAYNGFPLIIVLVGLYTFSSLLTEKKLNLYPLLYASVGVSLGILIHPNFPHNIYFYWVHIVGIALFPVDIPLGQGWYNYKIFKFIIENWFLLLYFLLGLSLFFKFLKKKYFNPVYLTSFFLAIIFSIATLRSGIFISYWVLFSSIFSTIILFPFIKEINWSRISNVLKKEWLFGFSLAVFGMIIIGAMLFSYRDSKDYLTSGQGINDYKGAAEWLSQNSCNGDKVFNTSFDQMPGLFYWNQKNYYLIGLDPTFLYKYDQNLYWKWHQVAYDIPGEDYNIENLHNILLKDFNTPYLFVDNFQKNDLIEYLDSTSESKMLFEKVYADDYAMVYKVKSSEKECN